MSSYRSLSCAKRGMASASNQQVKYIYELPYGQRNKLCRLLDAGGRWKELGFNFMHMDHISISLMEQAILRKESPTDELLHKWGEKNGTVNQLFVYLYKMKHMQAMLIIKDFVSPKYHHLLDREQTTELDSALLNSNSNVYLQSSPMLKGTAPPPDSAMGATAYSKNFYPDDCHMNMDKGHSLAKVNSSKVKMVYPGLPGQGNRSPVQAPQSTFPSVTNNCYANGNNLYPQLPKFQPSEDQKLSSTEGKVQNVAPERAQSSEGRTNKQGAACAAKEPSEAQPLVNTIPYEELKKATEGFIDANILGKGGFGTVYKGCWKDTTVAVKRLHVKEKDGDIRQEQSFKQSLTEMKVLQSCRIDNILPLYGVSLDGPEPCIVYQFMQNGSLEDRLRCKHNTPSLIWTQRGTIAKGVARGLYFLHTSLVDGKPLIHGDIKSANILLDSNLEPKIGDFGLTRYGPEADQSMVVVSHVHGTRYYLPHEYLKSRQLSTKVDIYSYGIVLLELATSKHVYDRRRKTRTLIETVQDCAQSNQLDSLRDTNAGDENQVIFSLLIHLGQKCSSYDRKDRPEMEQVLQQFRENPNEAVRRLSQGALVPPSTPGSPSPFDLQRWYDIRQGQATKPTNLTPNSAFPTTPTNAQAASPKMSPTFPPRTVLPSTSPPAPSVIEKEVVAEACLPVMLEQPVSSPENQLPMVSILGVTQGAVSHSGEGSVSEGATNAVAASPAGLLEREPIIVTRDLPGGELKLPDLDELDLSCSGLSPAGMLKGEPIIVTRDLRGGELKMTDLDELDLTSSGLLDDEDDDEDYNSQYTGAESKSEAVPRDARGQ
ncbi:pelle-like serine/threonine-protein kinase pik-1 [Amblyomma americanum]